MPETSLLAGKCKIAIFVRMLESRVILRRIAKVLVIAVLSLAMNSCGISKIRDLSVSSFGVKYITPTSTRSLKAKLLLGLDNPSIDFTVADIEGVIKYYDKDIINFTAGELPVQGKSDQVYELPCTATLCDKVSLLDLLAIASKKSLEGMTADVKLNASLKNGMTLPLTFNKIDLQQFTE